MVVVGTALVVTYQRPQPTASSRPPFVYSRAMCAVCPDERCCHEQRYVPLRHAVLPPVRKRWEEAFLRFVLPKTDSCMYVCGVCAYAAVFSIDPFIRAALHHFDVQDSFMGWV